MSSRTTLDRYVYEDIYPAFKAATDEKEITANINRTFLNYLAKRNLILAGDSPVAVADIGCGPCDTLIKYLTGVVFAPGFIVRATDFIPEYADAERGEALQTLASAQEKNTIKLGEFSVRAGNAFGGNLLDLLSGPRDGTKMRRAFRIVFASHVMYHAEASSDVQRLVADVANNVLARDAVCILYHVANTRGTFQEFRARFGSNAGATASSDTGAVTIDDPPAQIAAACGGMRLPLYQIEFLTKLHFGSLGDDEWRAFKEPLTYDALADSNPGAYEDLKRLYFVVQRAPLEFAEDHSATGLKIFIDEIREVIEANHGVLPLAERMQVFSRATPRRFWARQFPRHSRRVSKLREENLFSVRVSPLAHPAIRGSCSARSCLLVAGDDGPPAVCCLDRKAERDVESRKTGRVRASTHAGRRSRETRT